MLIFFHQGAVEKPIMRHLVTVWYKSYTYLYRVLDGSDVFLNIRFVND